MEYIILWLYIIVGFCIGAEYVARASEKVSNVDAPLLLLVGALLIYGWPIYLIYYYSRTKDI